MKKFKDLLSIENKIRLKKFGWFENREINDDSAIMQWKKDGYVIFPVGIEVYKSFGEIEITHLDQDSVNEEMSDFKAIDAAWRIDPLWVHDLYENLAKSKLLPIGQGYSRHITYLLSERAEIYAGFDDLFWLAGCDFNDFFDSVFTGKKFNLIS